MTKPLTPPERLRQKIEYSSVKLPKTFVDWARAKARREGKLLYRVICDRFAEVDLGVE